MNRKTPGKWTNFTGLFDSDHLPKYPVLDETLDMSWIEHLSTRRDISFEAFFVNSISDPNLEDSWIYVKKSFNYSMVQNERPVHCLTKFGNMRQTMTVQKTSFF